jgi:uncharacterized protein with GYD domain
LGGQLICGYVTTGQYDVVLVVEMPNSDAMTRAFSAEEFGKLAAEAP